MPRRSSWMEAEYDLGGPQLRVATIVSDTYRDEGGYAYAETDVSHEHFIDVPEDVQAMTDIPAVQERLTELLSTEDYFIEGVWDMLYDTTMRVAIATPDPY